MHLKFTEGLCFYASMIRINRSEKKINEQEKKIFEIILKTPETMNCYRNKRQKRETFEVKHALFQFEYRKKQSLVNKNDLLAGYRLVFKEYQCLSKFSTLTLDHAGGG